MSSRKTRKGKQKIVNDEKEEPFTEDDYMDALRKASRPIEKTAIPTQLDDENEEAED